MKYLFSLLLMLPVLVVAQQKDLTDTLEFRYGLPVSEDDTSDEVRSDEDPANQWLEVRHSEIPRKLRRILDRKDIYEGWDKGTVYYDKSIDQYLVRMKVGDATRTYGFAANGDQVSFTEERTFTGDSLD